jgi:hypothetical protein
MTSTINKGKPAGAPASNQYGEFAVKYCSPAQARFIARLLAERVHDFEIENPDRVNKKHASRIIEQLLACPKKPEAIKPISEKQISYIDLLSKARKNGETIIRLALLSNNVASVHQLNGDQAKFVIDRLLIQPKALPPITVTVGAYRIGDTYYSIRKVRDSEALYCLRYNEELKAWDKDPKAIYDLKPENRLSLSDASAFGIATGTCVHCARTLTLQKSVVAGMGKWCASHYN